MKKAIALLILVVLATTTLFGCNKNNDTAKNETVSSKSVKISFLNSKGEIQTQLEDAAKAFTKDNPDITVEIIAAPTGQSPFEKISTMYASGNAPALAMLDTGDILKFSDKFADLSKEKWINDAVANSLEPVKTADGKVMGFPLTIEGDGIIYNKNILDKAGIDPNSIKTMKDLENAFKMVRESGVAPLAISPMDWSLGAHLFATTYAAQSNDPKEVNKFIEGLKLGEVDLAKNNVFNGFMDTFDMMKKYNIDSKDPLAATYEKDQQYMGSGEVGFWFMGNWTWPQIKDFAGNNENFGFIPVSISNDAKDYGNSAIAAGVTKSIGLDKTNNNEEQQKAAKLFLEWLVYSANGQDALVNKANVIPAFKNITLQPSDPLSKSIKNYLNNGNTIQFMNTLPGDHWKEVGASMQKYLANKIDRAGLASEIQNYWKNVK